MDPILFLDGEPVAGRDLLDPVNPVDLEDLMDDLEVDLQVAQREADEKARGAAAMRELVADELAGAQVWGCGSCRAFTWEEAEACALTCPASGGPQ